MLNLNLGVNKAMLDSALAGTDPGTGDQPAIKPVTNPKSPGTEQFDVRDIIANFVLSGYKGGKLDDQLKGDYQKLFKVLPGDQAQKLLTQISLYNQRPESQKMDWKNKLTSFYNIGSSDPVTNQLLTKTKGLGYGPIEGVNTSSSYPLTSMKGLNTYSADLLNQAMQSSAAK